MTLLSQIVVLSLRTESEEDHVDQKGNGAFMLKAGSASERGGGECTLLSTLCPMSGESEDGRWVTTT
jgi:hypothetical protein